MPRHPPGGRAVPTVADALNRQDGSDADDRVGRRQDHDIGIADRSTTPVPVGLLHADEPDPKLAVRPGTAPTTAGSGWRFDLGVSDHVRLHPVVALGSSVTPGCQRLQTPLSPGRVETGIEQLGAHEVSRDVAIPGVNHSGGTS